MFIVFEGIDGAGKSTQIELLKHHWEAPAPVWYTRQPGGSLIGQRIRHLLLEDDEPVLPESELLLFAADRAQHVAQIRDRVEQGHIVICDRYTASTIAYQGAGRGQSIKIIKQLNEISTGGLKPFDTVYFRTSVATGLQRASLRGGKNKLDSQPIDFYERVYSSYEGQSMAQCWHRLDAESLSEQEITTQLIDFLNECWVKYSSNK